MLEFRSLNYEYEIDEVVELIKRNLEPEYTKEFLIWKHINNPFGPSLSMVATYQEKIVGVVFYMRYNFYNQKCDSIKCVRPVDGCTSTDMRGKGVFKKLMKKGLEAYKDDYQILLATPNSSSYPEVLKLGWKEPLHNYIYKICLLFPSKLKKGEMLREISKSESSSEIIPSGEYFQVGNSLEFIQWRYQDSNYRKVMFKTAKEKILYVVYRIDLVKGMRTVILCSTYGDNNILKKVLKRVLAKEKTIFLYFLENPLNREFSSLFSLKHRKALIVFKGNNNRVPDNLLITLGDLEGKL